MAFSSRSFLCGACLQGMGRLCESRRWGKQREQRRELFMDDV